MNFKSLIFLILVIASFASVSNAAEQKSEETEVKKFFFNKFNLLKEKIGIANEKTDSENLAEENEVAAYKLTLDKVSKDRFFNTAILRGLNKTTAVTSILKARLNQPVKFGQLTIIAHKCWQAPASEKPDSKILLEILTEQTTTEGQTVSKQVRIFYGWLIASSPSVSSLEDPIYDVVALNCQNE